MDNFPEYRKIKGRKKSGRKREKIIEVRPAAETNRSLTECIYTTPLMVSDFELWLIQVLKQNPVGSMMLANLWTAFIVNYGVDAIKDFQNSIENFCEFIRNVIIQNRPDLFGFIENKSGLLLSTIEAKSPLNISKYEANIIQIINKNGATTIDECVEKIKQNGDVHAVIPTHHQLKTFVHYRPNIFDFDENSDTICGIYKANEMPEKITRCKIYTNPTMSDLDVFIIQLLKQHRPAALSKLWYEFDEFAFQGGLCFIPEFQNAPKNIFKLLGYIQDRPELFSYVENKCDLNLYTIEAKSPETVSKNEASIIQIIRKNGFTTIDECILKLKQNGVVQELIPTHYQLKTFIHYRPNIFHFDESTDTICGMYKAHELPKKIMECGIVEVFKLLLGSDQDVTNSARINLVKDQRQVILFKSEWLYSKLNEFWDSCQNMVDSLMAQNAVGTHRQYIMHGSHYLNLEWLVAGHPNTDILAREIVDVLLTINAGAHRIQNNNDLFDSLTKITRDYLQNTFSKNRLNKSRSLINFTEFYPSLFRKGRNGLLELVPLKWHSMSCLDLMPYWPAKEEKEDLVVIQNMFMLMTIKPATDSIIVVDNHDRSVYSISWLHENMPRVFPAFSKKELRKMVYTYPKIFEQHDPLMINLASDAHRLCEKTISMDIINITRQQPDISPQEIVLRLLPHNRMKMHDASDLLHFLQRHKYFHLYELEKYFSYGKSAPRFEEAFNCLAPPNEVIEENIMEI